MNKKLIALTGGLALCLPGFGGVTDAKRNRSMEMNAEKGVASVSPVKDGVKVLSLGNSITLHGSLPSIGWTNAWGMAAIAGLILEALFPAKSGYEAWMDGKQAYPGK